MSQKSKQRRCHACRHYLAPIILMVVWLGSVSLACAQGTSFTYQGRLTDGGAPANGNYDLQFALWDSAGAGLQIGSTQAVNSVSVSNGIFTVMLDFGANAFAGGNRFLEINLRPAGSGSFTLLSPRQQVTSTPYAIRSLGSAQTDGLTSACAGCVQDANINSVSGSKVNGTIPVASVPAGSGNYVQNTANQQSSSNFNISGDGTAAGTLRGNIVRATTQFNIGSNRVLSAPGLENLFVGPLAGNNNTGSRNAFLGVGAGGSNTTGSSNAFFGAYAGFSNTTGGLSAFFGSDAGSANTTGSENSFFGYHAGSSNTTGAKNSFFGKGAGRVNTASDNSFFGAGAGQANTIGTRNSFFGLQTGFSNTTGNDNSLFGYLAGAQNTGSANSFFGSFAGRENTTGGENAFFGDDAGALNTSGDRNAFFGSSAGSSNTTGFDNAFFGRNAGASNTTGYENAFFGTQAGFSNTGIANAFFGDGAGSNNTTGDNNAFFGRGAGGVSTTGNFNAFFGRNAGENNVTGSNNTIIGDSADVGANNLSNASAIGDRAFVTQNNSLVLGSIDGVNNATADTSVGVGTTAPITRLHVVRNANLIATPANHVALIDNSANGNSADVLALRIAYTGVPGSSNNFITFFDGNGASLGSIQGNGAGGVELGGPGSDYAEWMPRLYQGEALQPGDIVGVFGGRITQATRGAAQVMVVSGGPIVAGNDPGELARPDYARVAFIGQVKVRVRGPVQAGDYIVPSGLADGVGMAFSEARLTPALAAQIVGRALQAARSTGINSVLTLVGLPHDAVWATLLRQKDEQIATLEARTAALEQLVGARVSNHSKKPTGRIKASAKSLKN